MRLCHHTSILNTFHRQLTPARSNSSIARHVRLSRILHCPRQRVAMSTTSSPAVDVIHLDSDGYSPNGKPHSLPALHYRSPYGGDADTAGGSEQADFPSDKAKELVERRGWQPSWEFGMYRQAHYHTTTHELLFVLRGDASIMLGGSDQRAKPPPPPPSSLPLRSSTTGGASGEGESEGGPKTEHHLRLRPGDILLIPAGYTHRSLESSHDFTMLGCYPRGAASWNMRYPNVNGCRYDVDEIVKLVDGAHKKALFDAQDPVKGQGQERGEGVLDRTWFREAAAH
ncbi:uncharacterized protein PFL1_01286 [Pseudozyma flocculosa PF-1]|uniref:uncharacterized protein n=1 Tax=Pseudozyma flocculosa PF-1 TaxID=1277687 RepID=UPI0004560B14|nr:uncharacterized protein PFL1_01286 [Pseudozyma flocculosa PF-1]EPQ31097.1 hypothetical protein PFL1_01286 [Pseudozyma flocculosa PF-1]